MITDELLKGLRSMDSSIIPYYKDLFILVYIEYVFLKLNNCNRSNSLIRRIYIHNRIIILANFSGANDISALSGTIPFYYRGYLIGFQLR